MSEDRVQALRRAVEASPDDGALRLILAETLEAAGSDDEALEEYGRLLQLGALPADAAVRAGHLACDAGRLELARGCLEMARLGGVVEGVGALEARVEDLIRARGLQRVRLGDGGEAGGLLERAERVTFEDVGGLEDVKKTIHRMIILPLSRPDLYQRYGRRAGGGVLVFGPPGCGKTLLARATAGECGLPFFNIRIEAILDPYFGMSEQNLHAAFEEGRREAPCVLFLDELDALGFARRKQQGAASRGLVDILLQELDAIGSDNRNVLVLAATNAPWDVDEALLRPGRFDRRIFVPPPDLAARRRILEIMLRDMPTRDVSLDELARATELFSGADLRAVVEHSIDEAIDRALDEGTEPPLLGSQLKDAASSIRPTTLEWLDRARSYVEFANLGERYKEVAEFLRSKEVRRHLRP